MSEQKQHGGTDAEGMSGACGVHTDHRSQRVEVEKQKVPTVIKRKEIPLPQLGGKNGIYYVKKRKFRRDFLLGENKIKLVLRPYNSQSIIGRKKSSQNKKSSKKFVEKKNR